MLENQKIRPAQVIGPLGEPLTLDSLPPASTTPWVGGGKGEGVAAARGGAARGGGGRRRRRGIADRRRSLPALYAEPRGIYRLATRGRPQRHARTSSYAHQALPRSVRAPAALLIGPSPVGPETKAPSKGGAFFMI